MTASRAFGSTLIAIAFAAGTLLVAYNMDTVEAFVIGVGLVLFATSIAALAVAAGIILLTLLVMVVRALFPNEGEHND